MSEKGARLTRGTSAGSGALRQPLAPRSSTARGLTARLLELQRAAGNQAVVSLLGDRAVCGLLQSKLTVNKPGDRFEQQADRMAEAVMRMHEPQDGEGLASFDGGSAADLQRVCSVCKGEHHQPGTAPADQAADEDDLQAREAPGGMTEVTPDLGAQIDSMRGGGRPMSRSERAFFEPRFGRDFSAVRIHDDARAAKSAQGLQASAYTTGRDIFFAAGRFAPDTREGRGLLAHELSHVLQQGGDGAKSLSEGTRGERSAASKAPLASSMLQRQSNTGPGTPLPANFPFLPKQLKQPSGSLGASPRLPSVVTADYVVQGQDKRWFYVHFTCMSPTYTTARDAARVGPYATSSQPSGNYQCTYRATPLEDYLSSIEQGKEARRQAFWQAILHRPLETGAMKPIYIDFDLFFLWRQPASVIAKGFTAGQLAMDLASGEYQGGLGDAILDGVLGALVKKLWPAAHLVPRALRGEKRTEWLQEITKIAVKDAIG